LATTARKKAAPKQLTTAQRLDSIIKSARKIMRKDKGLNEVVPETGAVGYA